MDDLRFRKLRPVGKRVHRLGLSLNYGIDADGPLAADDAWMREFGKVVHDRGPKLAWSF